MRKNASSRAGMHTGFSLVEMILYLGLTAVLLVGIVTAMIRLMDGRDRLTKSTEVTQNVRYALSRIESAVRTATNITTTQTGTLRLGSGSITNYVSFTLENDAIMLRDAGSPLRLTSPAVKVESLVFTNRSFPQGPQIVEIRLKASPAVGSGGKIDLKTAVSIRRR